MVISTIKFSSRYGNMNEGVRVSFEYLDAAKIKTSDLLVLKVKL